MLHNSKASLMFFIFLKKGTIQYYAHSSTLTGLNHIDHPPRGPLTEWSIRPEVFKLKSSRGVHSGLGLPYLLDAYVGENACTNSSNRYGVLRRQLLFYIATSIGRSTFLESWLRSLILNPVLRTEGNQGRLFVVAFFLL